MFLVNGKHANIPSIELKIGDKVSIKETKANKNYILQILPAMKEAKGAGIPRWMQLDSENAILEIKGKPSRDDFGAGIDAQMVVEFYSR